MLLVWVAVVALLRFSHQADGRGLGFLGPLVLMLAALLPTLAAGRPLTELGLRPGRSRQDLLVLVFGGAGMLGLTFVAVGLLKLASVPPPLAASFPHEQWLAWVLFQFAWAALPEELFFRGYLLSNGMRLLSTALKPDSAFVRPAAIALSAGAFALAHVLVLGNAAAALTFVPGLFFAWAFVRTGSLIAPVLLHGLANIGYVLMVQAMA